jgi:hypothetical protein
LARSCVRGGVANRVARPQGSRPYVRITTATAGQMRAVAMAKDVQRASVCTRWSAVGGGDMAN